MEWTQITGRPTPADPSRLPQVIDLFAKVNVAGGQTGVLTITWSGNYPQDGGINVEVDGCDGTRGTVTAITGPAAPVDHRPLRGPAAGTGRRRGRLPRSEGRQEGLDSAKSAYDACRAEHPLGFRLPAAHDRTGDCRDARGALATARGKRTGYLGIVRRFGKVDLSAGARTFDQAAAALRKATFATAHKAAADAGAVASSLRRAAAGLASVKKKSAAAAQAVKQAQAAVDAAC